MTETTQTTPTTQTAQVIVGMVFEFEGVSEDEARQTVRQWFRSLVRANPDQALLPGLSRWWRCYTLDEATEGALRQGAAETKAQATRIQAAEARARNSPPADQP